VIAVIAASYSALIPSEHSSGRKLADIADLVIDNCAPARRQHGGRARRRRPVGPGSTIGNTAVVNALKVLVAQDLAARGQPPLVLASAYEIGAEASRALRGDLRRLPRPREGGLWRLRAAGRPGGPARAGDGRLGHRRRHRPALPRRGRPGVRRRPRRRARDTLRAELPGVAGAAGDLADESDAGGRGAEGARGARRARRARQRGGPVRPTLRRRPRPRGDGRGVGRGDGQQRALDLPHVPLRPAADAARSGAAPSSTPARCWPPPRTRGTSRPTPTPPRRAPSTRSPAAWRPSTPATASG
jgi:hypothetical protein